MTVEERIEAYRAAFSDAGGDEVRGRAELQFFAELLNAEPQVGLDDSDIDPREVAWGFETLAMSAHDTRADDDNVIALYQAAYRLRTSAWRRDEKLAPIDLWMLIATGVCAQQQPELRLTLGKTHLDWLIEGDEERTWEDQIWRHCVRALALLARKGSSWQDIDDAQESLRYLAAVQRAEHPNLESEDSLRFRRQIGLYHVAEALASLGAYLRSGGPASVLSALQRHAEHARFLLAGVGDQDLEAAAMTLGPALAVMANASIWANTSRLSESARRFARHLAADDAENPVSELWYSQRQALTQSLLDPFKSAVSVEMPTSAGKTLLAELAIVQTLALNPGSTIGYVVPTRALVNQITRRLRADLAGSEVEGRPPMVESAVPVFELDPTEAGLLDEKPDILVTTPEKLDLLVKIAHPAVEDLALLVVDEAHQISDPTRGPRLELLLANLKRERGDRCRFLLLTPFLPNASELAAWLGADSNAIVRVNWKPAEQLRASVRWRNRDKVTQNVLQLLPSVTQAQSWEGTEIFLGPSPLQDVSGSRERVSASTAASLAHGKEGGVLVLTRGLGTAESRAKQIAEIAGTLPIKPSNGLSEAASEYIAAELGADYPLADLIRSGVAFHHAGLPPEVRALVEILLECGSIRVVCGTSTLAQGVNFPLSAVILETLKVPQGRGKRDRPMTFSEFWNIAGRAGRALKDPLGLVLHPVTTLAQQNEFRDYLKGEAQDVVSALLDVLTGMDRASETYGLKLVRENPALSQFLQYLAHALRVAGYDRAVAELEEILRSSLGFYRLQTDNREVAEGLIRWSTGFLERTRGSTMLGIADVTGFSLPTVGWMASQLPHAARDSEFWSPDHLYGEDLRPLTDVIRLLAEVPELHLAPTEEPGGIDPERIAGIVRDWVGGKSLPEIADRWYPSGDTEEGLRRAGRYLFRDLAGQVPWGMGALQTVTGIAAEQSEHAELARRAPAMAFYGVSTESALTVRMVGVPRAAADQVSEDLPSDLRSFAQLREWVGSVSDAEWAVADVGRGLSPGVLKRIWDAVGGTAA